MMSDLTWTLGEEVYEALPEAGKRDLDLFVWAGCSMHKDLNSVKGGNKAMMSYGGLRMGRQAQFIWQIETMQLF